MFVFWLMYPLIRTESSPHFDMRAKSSPIARKPLGPKLYRLKLGQKFAKLRLSLGSKTAGVFMLSLVFQLGLD